jgi:hypothetical protein
MHLCHKEVGECHLLQSRWIQHALTCCVSAGFLNQLIIIKLIILVNSIDIPNMQNDIIIDLLINLLLNDFCNFNETSAAWCKLDYLLYNISPLEQSRTLFFAPHKMVRLGSWDDGQCENYTSFLGEDLVRIYRCFDLQSLADDEGFLRIPTGCSNRFGVQCCCKIH